MKSIFNRPLLFFKSRRTIYVALFLLSIAGVFYWYAVRPAQIRHACSWVKHHQDMIPARPAMTIDQMKEKGLIKDCTAPNATYNISNVVQPIFFPNLCEDLNQTAIDEYGKAKPEVPANDWWERATSEDYQFCLHDKGL